MINDRINKRFLYIIDHIAFKDVTNKEWADMLGKHFTTMGKYVQKLREGKGSKTLKEKDLEILTKFINKKLYGTHEPIQMLWWTSKIFYPIETKVAKEPIEGDNLIFKTKQSRMEFVHLLLEKKGISYKQLAKECGDRANVYWHNVKNKPTTKMLAHLVDNYNIRLGYLLGFESKIFRDED